MHILSRSHSQHERRMLGRRLSSDIRIRYAQALDLMNNGPGFRMPHLGQMTEGRRQEMAAQNKRPPAPSKAVTTPASAKAGAVVAGLRAAIDEFLFPSRPLASAPNYSYSRLKKEMFPELDW